MAIEAACPNCMTVNEIDEDQAGTRVRCEECNKMFTAPSAKQAKKAKAARDDDEDDEPATPPRPSRGPTRQQLLMSIVMAFFSLIALAAVIGLGAFGYWSQIQTNPPVVVPPKGPPGREEKKQGTENTPEKKEKDTKTELAKNKTDDNEKKKDTTEPKKEDVAKKATDNEPAKKVETKKPTPIADQRFDMPERIDTPLVAGRRHPHNLEPFAHRLGDIVVRRAVPNAFAHRPIWHPQGKSFYVIQLHALVMELDASNFSVIRDHLHYEAGKPVYFRGGLAHSAEGLLALGTTDHAKKGEDLELYVLHMSNMQTKKKIPCPNASHIASAPNLSVAFVGGRNSYPDGKPAEFLAVDLKSGEVVKPELDFALDPRTFVVSPDGQHLFGTDGKAIARFRIDGMQLIHEETSEPVIAASTEPSLEMSSDGSEVWLLGLDPAKRHVPDGASFKVFSASKLADETKTSPADVFSAALDSSRKAFVWSDAKTPLAIWRADEGRAYYDFKCGTPRQIIMNPAGGSLLLLAGPDLFHVRWSEKPAE